MTHFITLALYIGALVLWLRTLVQGEERQGPPVAAMVAVAGVLTHLVALVRFTLAYGELPLVGLGASLSALSFIIGLGLVATLGLGEAGRVGVLLIPLMILLEGIALGIGIRPSPAAQDFRGAWFALHVTLAFVGIGAMALSAAAGAFYLLQFRELKKKRMGRWFRFLPPLAVLGRVGRIGAVTGFTTLTLSLALGWAWTVRFRNSFQSGDPKTVWAVFVWGVILAAVLVRRGGGGAERRGAQASVVGFLLIVASYVVVRVVTEGGLFL